MGQRCALVYSDKLTAYEFSPAHPLNPIRLKATYELLVESGLIRAEEDLLVEPRLATEEELATVHAAEYVEAVKRASEPGADWREFLDYGLGPGDNPIFVGMHEASALIAGGTLEACDMVMQGHVDHAFNPAGGLHHAQRESASGFCVYNDAALGIQRMVDKYGLRVLYIDTDAHHGDGVQEIFYRDARVLTISFHETGRFLFPGTGFPEEIGEGPGLGYSVNVPLEPQTGHESWLVLYKDLVPELARQFKPDVLVTQNGCDGHVTDPLAHLSAATQTYWEFARLAHDLAHEVAGGRLIALGGGGYDLIGVVPRAWALVWAALTDQNPPGELPPSWRERWQPHADHPLPASFADDLSSKPSGGLRTEIHASNLRTLRQARQLLAEVSRPP